MAKNFYECATNGGKIINKRTKKGNIIKICYDKEGKSHIKQNKKKNKQTAASKDSLNKLVAHFKDKNNK